MTFDDKTSDEQNRPLLAQADPRKPIFRGEGNGVDLLCTACNDVVVLQNVAPDAVFDLRLRCAACAGVTSMPAFPSGRGLGGIVHSVRDDHQAVGTFALDMDQVIVGDATVEDRRRKIDLSAGTTVAMDTAGIEQLLIRARRIFRPLLAAAQHQHRTTGQHPLLQLMGRLEVNLGLLRPGDRTVDVSAFMALHRAVTSFARWEHDPSFGRLLQESKHADTFDHNVVLLEVASMLERAGLGPEFAPPDDRRTADLRLRISASRWIELDTKTPRVLQFTQGDVAPSVAPRRILQKALRACRGQFSTSGILVVAGDCWIDELDTYAAAATALLDRPLPSTASAAAEEHHQRLLGIMLAATGYEVADRSFQPRVLLRWVPSSRYMGDIDLELAANVDGPYTVNFTPGVPSPTQEDRLAKPSPTFLSHPPPGARFRKVANGGVEVEGRVVNTQLARRSGPSVAFRLPEGYRPVRAMSFDLACEAGFSSATVEPDGSVLLDPGVGWIDLHGIRFQASP